jgi:hypothetical protein
MATTTYRVYFISFNYYATGTAPTEEAAKEVCRKACFEARIETADGTPVGFWSPISGYRPYR